MYIDFKELVHVVVGAGKAESDDWAHGQRSLAGYIQSMGLQELDTTEGLSTAQWLGGWTTGT